MTLVTRPVKASPAQATAPRTVREWLDSLSAGTCDQATFLRGVEGLCRKSPEEGWELLSLIDQYFRRGKLSSSTFATLKSHLSTVLLGPSPRAPNSMPMLLPGQLTQPVDISLPQIAERAAAMNFQAGAAASQHPSLSRSVAIGDTLRGRYRIQGVLGQGGMGTVFEAVDLYRIDGPGEEQKLAVKVLHTEVTQRPQLLAELRREFQHLQTLSHPNIVRVHEYDRDGDVAFFTMEYLQGMSLQRLLSAREGGALKRHYSLAIIRDAGAALAHAHARGVVHGDLNPGNIFITANGEVRVLDFGAANKLRRDPWISEFENSQQIPVATPTYASCQVLEGEAPDARDDVFGFACVAYVLLSGKHPFEEQTALQARSSQLSPSRPPAISTSQWKALRAGLEFERDRRPAAMQLWLDRLYAGGGAQRLPPPVTLMANPPAMSPSWRWLVLATALALLVGTSWLLVTRFDSLSEGTSSITAAVAGVFANAGNYLNELRDKIHKPDLVVDLPDPTVSAPEDGPTADEPRAPMQPNLNAQPSSPSPVSHAEPTDAATVPTPVPAAPVIEHPAATQEPSAEVLTANPTIGTVATPSPRSRIELAADTLDVIAADTLAKVIVRRSGSLRAEASFNWWTESGTAKPGQDFLAVKTHVDTIEAGKNSATLSVQVAANPDRKSARSFYVVIDQASDAGASLGPRTVTMVTLTPAE